MLRSKLLDGLMQWIRNAPHRVWLVTMVAGTCASEDFRRHDEGRCVDRRAMANRAVMSGLGAIAAVAEAAGDAVEVMGAEVLYAVAGLMQ